jgi:hypothetical protein
MASGLFGSHDHSGPQWSLDFAAERIIYRCHVLRHLRIGHDAIERAELADGEEAEALWSLDELVERTRR